MGYEAQIDHRLLMPQDHAQLWRVIRKLCDDHGLFTREDLRKALPLLVRDDTIDLYLTRLKRGKFVVNGAAAPDGSPAYKLARPQPQPPELRADGKPSVQSIAREQMWRAMKMLTWWTIRDLTIAASTDDVQLRETAVTAYVGHLLAARLLAFRGSGKADDLYRLKPTSDTGPAAPRIMRATFVWDDNTASIAGPIIAREEVRL